MIGNGADHAGHRRRYPYVAVAWVVLTNGNHSRAANRVRASTGARTLIHADDTDHARSQETELDDVLEVGAHARLPRHQQIAK